MKLQVLQATQISLVMPHIGEIAVFHSVILVVLAWQAPSLWSRCFIFASKPGLTPAQLRTMLHNDCSETMAAGTLTGYGSLDNAMGGPRRVLVQRYAKATSYVNNLSVNTI